MSYPYTIQHVDTDGDGAVHFSRYFSLAEAAILSDSHLDYPRWCEQGLRLVVRSTEAKYHSPLCYPAFTDTNVMANRVGPASIRFRTSIATEDHVVAEVYISFGVVNRSTGKPSVIPPELLGRLEGIRDK